MKETTVHAAEVAVAQGTSECLSEKAVHQRDMDAIKKLQPEDFWIHTVSAKKFYPKRPDLNQYDIGDIAHATARVNRYNGHMDHAYSVGQHSVLVALQVLKMFSNDVDMWDGTTLGSPEWMEKRSILGLQALLHDATEAYIPDMPSPIKLLLPDFMEMEEKIHVSLFAQFDLPYPLPVIVHEVDKGIRGSEIKHLFTSLKGDNVWAEDIYKIDITPWPAAYTKRRFLDMFNELEAIRYA